MADSNSQKEISQEQVEGKAEEIVVEGTRVTERVSALVLGALQLAEDGLDRYAKIAESVVSGAVKGVERVVPDDAESTLRKVYNGLTDAGEKAAESLRLTFEEARERGKTFGEAEFDRTVEQLKNLEKELVDTLQGFTKRTSSEVSDQLEAVVRHAQRASSGMGASIQAALDAAKDHPTGLIKESAQAGVDLSKNLAGGILGAAAQFLDKAAKSLQTKGDEEEE